MPSNAPYKLVYEDGYFYVEGPAMVMRPIDRYIQAPPAGCQDEVGYSRRAAQRLIDMLNLVFQTGQRTPRCPSFDD